MVGGPLGLSLGLGARAAENKGNQTGCAYSTANGYRARVSVLNHEIVSAGSPKSRQKQMLLLHGIYGAGRNWASVARRLAAARPDWRIVLVDLRCHGKSPPFPPPHTLDACVRDLAHLEEHLGRPADAVLGHSFGGKVALLHARRRAKQAPAETSASAKLPASPTPRTLPQLGQTWVVDSAPGPWGHSLSRSRGMAWQMLEALRRNPGPFASRRHATDTIRAEGFSGLVANWMATNVVEGDNGQEWHWRIDPDDMEALLCDYARIDAWPAVESAPPGASVHIVKARASQVLDAPALDRIRMAGDRTGRVFLHEVEGGHWLNIENPTALHRLLANGLTQQRFS